MILTGMFWLMGNDWSCFIAGRWTDQFMLRLPGAPSVMIRTCAVFYRGEMDRPVHVTAAGGSFRDDQDVCRVLSRGDGPTSSCYGCRGLLPWWSGRVPCFIAGRWTDQFMLRLPGAPSVMIRTCAVFPPLYSPRSSFVRRNRYIQSPLSNNGNSGCDLLINCLTGLLL